MTEEEHIRLWDTMREDMFPSWDQLTENEKIKIRAENLRKRDPKLEEEIAEIRKMVP